MKKLYEETAVQDIAAAIREKTGEATTYKIGEMASAIQAISAGAINDPDNETTVMFPQTNAIVAQFVDNVEYDTSDYSTTQVTNYYNQATTYTKEDPRPLEVNAPSGTALTIVSGEKTRQETATSNPHKVYNMEPLQNGSVTFGGKTYKVMPSRGVRMIYAPSIYNPRDLGGWACDGGVVKYGLIFRGGELTGSKHSDITAEDISRLKDWCGVKVDLDLRNNTESSSATSSSLGAGVEYYRYSINAYAQGFSSSEQQTFSANAAKKVMDSVIAGKPVYIHCVSGADRTATIVFVLLSLLGVSPSDKDKEYELTSFTSETNGARFRNTNYSVINGNSWYALMQYFRTNFQGSNDREKVTAWAVTKGISEELINQFRACMINGTPGVIDSTSYSVTNNLTNCTTNNSATTVNLGDGYSATITPDSGYVLDGATVTVTMNGEDVTTSVYSSGVIQIASVTGNIVITIAAAVYTPSYTNILSTGLTPNTKSGVWNGTGYQNGAYASSASPYYGSDAACFCTGAIPYNAGDVFYVKGAVLEGSGHNRLGALSQNGCYWCKEWASLSGMATVTKLADKYYKIELDSSHANYKNVKYIMFSAQGSANNLVITRNELIDPSIVENIFQKSKRRRIIFKYAGQNLGRFN